MMLELIDREVEIAFDKLCSQVHGCDLCPRMKDSQRVLNHSSGPLSAKIMFIGEAPGRLGADSSGIPFHGDKAGHNFEALLEFCKLDRSQIFVTNAVLCNPRDEDGNNSTPTKIEAANCASHLKAQIDLINPQIVVTLGAVALESTKLIQDHYLSLKDGVRTANNWFNRILIPLYHPGQRAMLHRSFANQRSDYQFIADQFRKIERPKKQNHNTAATSIEIAVIVEYILSRVNNLSYFSLHKLFYLIEYNAFKSLGHRLTNAYIIRQKDGPYCTDLHIDKLKKSIPDFQFHFKGKSIILRKQTDDLFTESLLDEYDLENNVKVIIDKVLLEHGDKNNTALKRTVYFSRPMRNLLKIEKEIKVNMYNSPIIFTEKDI